MIYNRVLNDFLFFFFALFIFTSTFSIALAQISLAISLLLFLGIIIYKKKNPFPIEFSKLWIFIAAYIGWLIISSLFGKTPLKSVDICKEEWLFLAIPIGIYLFKIKSFSKKLIYAFAIGVLLVSIYGIIQHITGVYWFKDRPPYEAYNFGYRVKGFFTHRLTFGNYFSVAATFLTTFTFFSWNSLTKRNKILFTVTSLLGIIVTFLSYSYGPMLALLVGLVVLTFIKNKKISLYISSIIVILVVLFFLIYPNSWNRISSRASLEFNSSDPLSRLYIWDNSLTMIKENPLIGVGKGNFGKEFTLIVNGGRSHPHAHNDILNVAAVTGIPGSILFLAVWLSLLIYLSKKDYLKNPLIAASFVGSLTFLISSMTEATFADEEVRQMLMFVWASGLGTIICLKKEGTNLTDESKTS